MNLYSLLQNIDVGLQSIELPEPNFEFDFVDGFLSRFSSRVVSFRENAAKIVFVLEIIVDFQSNRVDVFDEGVSNDEFISKNYKICF